MLSQAVDNVANDRTKTIGTWYAPDIPSNAPFDEPTDAPVVALRTSTIGMNTLVPWYGTASECAILSRTETVPGICHSSALDVSLEDQVRRPGRVCASYQAGWPDRALVGHQAVSRRQDIERYREIPHAFPYARS